MCYTRLRAQYKLLSLLCIWVEHFFCMIDAKSLTTINWVCAYAHANSYLNLTAHSTYCCQLHQIVVSTLEFVVWFVTLASSDGILWDDRECPIWPFVVPVIRWSPDLALQNRLRADHTCLMGNKEYLLRYSAWGIYFQLMWPKDF